MSIPIPLTFKNRLSQWIDLKKLQSFRFLLPTASISQSIAITAINQYCFFFVTFVTALLYNLSMVDIQTGGGCFIVAFPIFCFILVCNGQKSVLNYLLSAYEVSKQHGFNLLFFFALSFFFFAFSFGLVFPWSLFYLSLPSFPCQLCVHVLHDIQQHLSVNNDKNCTKKKKKQ